MKNDDTKIVIVKYWWDHLKENSPWLVVFITFILFTTKAAFNGFMVYMVLAGTFLFFRYRYVYINNPSYRYLIILFCCFWGPMAISLIDAPHFERSMRSVSAHLGFLFVGLYIIYIGYDSARMSRLFKAVCYLTLFWCVDALIQYVFGYDLFGYPMQEGGGRLKGMFYPKERLGFFVACLSPLVFEWTRLYIKQSKWILIAPLLVFCVVVLSGSRSSWVMMIFSIFIYSVYLINFFGLKRALKYFSFGLLGLSIVFTAAYQTTVIKEYVQTTAKVFQFDYDNVEAATANRLSLWITAINMGKANIVNGVGVRAYRNEYMKYKGERDTWHLNVLSGKQNHPQTHPHQTFLEVFAEAGLVGVLGYLILIFIIFKLIFRCIREAYYEPVPWLMAAFLAFNPINAHKAIYSNYWSTFAWLLLMVGISCYREFKITKKAKA